MNILTDFPELSDIEVYIYKYVIANPKTVTHMSITELAEATNSSTASILRMCKKYGCKGFSEFKFKLQKELENPAFLSSDAFDTRYHDVKHFLEVTVPSKEFQNSMKKAANLLANKHLIVFAGSGSSNILAEYGTLYFSYLFNLTFRIEDINNYPLEFFPKELADETCIIVCSTSGNTVETTNYIRDYHRAGSSLIAITGNANSVLTNLADVSIHYSVPITMSGPSNLTTQVPCLYIIETLAGMVQKLRSEKK